MTGYFYMTMMQGSVIVVTTPIPVDASSPTDVLGLPKAAFYSQIINILKIFDTGSLAF